MVLGSGKLIVQLWGLRRNVGGAMRHCTPLTTAARVAVQEQFSSGIWGSCDTQRQVHTVAMRAYSGDVPG